MALLRRRRLWIIRHWNRRLRPWHIDAETRWPTFRRRHFQINFRTWKCMNFAKISLKSVPKIRINNTTALVQIMPWRRPGAVHYLNQWWLVYWRIYASLGFTELRPLKPMRHTLTSGTQCLYQNRIQYIHHHELWRHLIISKLLEELLFFLHFWGLLLVLSWWSLKWLSERRQIRFLCKSRNLIGLFVWVLPHLTPEVRYCITEMRVPHVRILIWSKMCRKVFVWGY